MLWALLNSIHHQEEIEETIAWNVTSSGEYSSNSSYKAQFFEATATSMIRLVWKTGGTIEDQGFFYMVGYPQ
jgi:hypothetical protein